MKRLAIFIIGITLLLAGCSNEEIIVNTEEDTSVILHPATTKEVTTEEMKTTEKVTTEAVTEETTQKKFLIAIDPGHQGPNVDMSAKEPNAPGSSEMKTKATGGATGQYSGVPEYQLNLDISLKLRDALQAEGYDVIMTREDNDTAISNAERAQLANTSGADVSIRIHANGDDDHSVNGALALVGSSSNQYVGYLYNDSYELADDILSSYCNATGMKNLGVQTTDTMTGINWSEIPVMILEMGFLSNETDDLNMQNSTYQEKMVSGIVDGVNLYFSSRTPRGEGLINEGDSGLSEKLQTIIDEETAKGNSISIGFGRVEDSSNLLLNNRSMQSASLIKLYVAGCIYELSSDGEMTVDDDTEGLIGKMLSVSDNDACNSLVKKLGGGDAALGMQKVNDYCSKHGLTETSMGRLMLDFDSDKDNYTSVADCTAFLQSMYNGNLAGSYLMLGYLKQQERTGKIPGGVPEGVETANKTGELDTVENDAAIIFADSGAYVLTVMMSDLKDTAAARETIKNISSEVYEYVK